MSSTIRRLNYFVAALFAVLGAVLFIAPGWAAPNFLWRISPFVAMTMGGWYLGSAFYAWDTARLGRWDIAYPSLVSLGTFSVLEAGVLILHANLLRFDAVLGLPYIVVLVAATAAAIAGAFEFIRRRPALGAGARASGSVVAIVVTFLIFVFFLVVVGAWGPSVATEGRIFPEKLSFFTLHGFTVFYLSIVLGAAAWLFLSRDMPSLLVLTRDGLTLLMPITLAAFINLGVFDFGAHPGQFAYIGVYVIATIGVLLILWQHAWGTGASAVPQNQTGATHPS